MSVRLVSRHVVHGGHDGVDKTRFRPQRIDEVDGCFDLGAQGYWFILDIMD